jgi:hypothetical protein
MQVKYLALMLATYADPDGSRVRPGLPVLAAVTGYEERTVRRHLRRLTDDFGLVQQTARGGGRKGQGRASTYRLTIPVDLLERVTLLAPGDTVPDSVDIQVSGHSTDSSDTQVSTQSPETPDNQVSTQSNAHPVDNSHSLDIQVSDETPEPAPIDRTSEATFGGLSGHFERLSGHPDVHLPPTYTNHTRPTPSPGTSATHDRASDETTDRPPSVVEAPKPTLDELLPISRPARPDPGPKCGHGLDAGCDDDGNPRCPLCRREAPAATRAAS